MPDRLTLSTAAMWAFLAAVGGAVRFLAEFLVKAPVMNARMFIFRLAVNCFISSFSGLVGAMMVTTVTDNQTWHYIAASIFGYLGVQGIEAVVTAMKKKLQTPA